MLDDGKWISRLRVSLEGVDKAATGIKETFSMHAFQFTDVGRLTSLLVIEVIITLAGATGWKKSQRTSPAGMVRPPLSS